MNRLLLGAIALMTSGCAAQMGGTFGHSIAHDPGKTATERDEGHVAWSAQGAVSTVAGKERGVLVGGELESRTEYRHGARWTSGAWLGYAWLPERELGAVGGELHADIGTRIEDGTFVRHGNYYVGGAGSLVIWATERHDAYDADATPWLLVRALEVVVGGRVRMHMDDDPAVSWGRRTDVALTLALRLRLISDLLE